jgi:predicted Na+-dependent transporter
MSFCSTVGAFFMLPLIVLVYIKTLSSQSISIPWGNIFISIFLIVLPTTIGLYVRKYNTTKKMGGKFIWEWMRAATSVFGGLFVFGALIVGLLLHWSELGRASWKLWVFAFAMEPMGAFFGYHASKLSGLTLKDNRTIAIECGVQNFTFTMVMITVSFGNTEEADEALLFPIM